MKKLYILGSFFIAFFLICTAFVSVKFHNKSSNGITGRTGSPGEGTCAGCHSGGSNATTVSINANPAFVANEYIQGQTYTITITVSGAGYSKFGFGAEILHLGNNTNAGVMTSFGGGVQVTNGPNGRKNAIQSAPKTGTNTADFSFQWVAPTNGIGCTIYVVGNCVDGNGSTSGDFARATSLTLSTPTMTALKEEDKNSLQAFNIFPNPAQDKINVTYNLTDPKHVTMQLLSINGGVIAELLSEDQENGVHAKNIDVPSEVASGVYFLKVMADNKTVAQRLVSIR